MVIYFLRHANAGERKFSPAQDDKRPLDGLGIEQSHNVGRALAALKVRVDSLITSPLLRASQTAAIVSEALGREEKVTTDPALRPEGTFEAFLELVARHHRQKAIMVVGHNPNLSEFLNKFLSPNGATIFDLRKGAIAKVEKEGRRPPQLKWLLTAKLVRALQEASAKSSRPKTVLK